MTITHRQRCLEEWIDYNGHMSEAYYVLAFGHATDGVLEQIGLGPDQRAATGTSVFTSEAHVRYLDQVGSGEELEIVSSVIGATDKVLWIWHEMWAGDSLRATEEVLGIHVDTTAGRVSAFPQSVTERIQAILVEPPAQAGRAIAVGSR